MSTEDNASGKSAYVSIGEASEKLGWPRSTIHRWCQSRKIAGAVQPVPGSAWKIPRAWVEQLLAAVRPTKRA